MAPIGSKDVYVRSSRHSDRSQCLRTLTERSPFIERGAASRWRTRRRRSGPVRERLIAIAARRTYRQVHARRRRPEAQSTTPDAGSRTMGDAPSTHASGPTDGTAIEPTLVLTFSGHGNGGTQRRGANPRIGGVALCNGRQRRRDARIVHFAECERDLKPDANLAVLRQRENRLQQRGRISSASARSSPATSSASETRCSSTRLLPRAAASWSRS